MPATKYTGTKSSLFKLFQKNKKNKRQKTEDYSYRLNLNKNVKKLN